MINSSDDDDSLTKTPIKILDAAQPTPQNFSNTYTISIVEYDFTGDDEESNTRFQFTESETVLNHF